MPAHSPVPTLSSFWSATRRTLKLTGRSPFWKPLASLRKMVRAWFHNKPSFFRTDLVALLQSLCSWRQAQERVKTSKRRSLSAHERFSQRLRQVCLQDSFDAHLTCRLTFVRWTQGNLTQKRWALGSSTVTQACARFQSRREVGRRAAAVKNAQAQQTQHPSHSLCPTQRALSPFSSGPSSDTTSSNHQ